MHSYLIIGGTKEERRIKAQDLVSAKRKTDAIRLLELVPEKGKKTISIEQVRDIKKVLIVKPHANQLNIVLICEAQNLTIPAQNALLKTLEEPPDKALIVLTSQNKYLLLPTVISRCAIISIDEPALENEVLNIDFSDEGKILDYIATHKEIYESAESALNFLRSVEIALSKDLTNDNSRVLKNIYHYKEYLFSIGINSRLVLENIFLLSCGNYL